MESKRQRNLCFVAVVYYLLLTSTSPAAGYRIRLVGSTGCSGRVEIYHRGAWGTVCDDFWDLNDAKVVCRQLGCGKALNAPGSAEFGEGSGKIWLDDVECSGSERSLTGCRHREFGEHNCGHSEDAGVVCQGVRLVGSTRCSGRVEIYHSGAWGTVCDDNWDTNDAQVVCKELDCGRALGAPHSAHFGQGSGPIWLDDVGCSGGERSVTECSHPEFGEHNCNHGEDAGVVCQVDLQKPSISLTPAGEVTWGQDISITCSISTEMLGGTFILEKTSGSFRKTSTSSSGSSTFNIYQVNFDNEGLYQCQYEKKISSFTFSSPKSNSVRLLVTVTFPKPSISMNPAGEVPWGQSVYFTCLISTHISGGMLTLRQTSDLFRKTQTSNATTATFNIPQVDFSNEGLYQCQYGINTSSQSLSSPVSDSVTLSVSVRLPQPSIVLTSPDGGLVWGPHSAEVTKGYSFVLTCSINSSYSDGHFIFIFPGSNNNDTKPAVNRSASFTFPVAEYGHQGNYSCVYEVTLSSRAFISTETTQINVVIKMPASHLLSSVFAGILLLLLLVLFGVYLVFRRRRQQQQPKQPIAVVQTQIAAKFTNEYNEGGDEDEEEDYVNVDLARKQFNGRVESEEEESNNYEDPESDEDHDYENAGPAENVMKTKVFCFSVEKSREEEENEEDDEEEEEISDNDYENVTQPCGGQTVDSDEESEDVYQDF